MNVRVVGIGELLWDLLPSGRKLGGAPGNFTYHAHALGAEAKLISRVGNDEPGREALAQLGRLGVPTDCIEIDPVLPTGTVGVELSEGGQPHYKIHEGAAWDAIAGEAAGRAAAARAQVICFGSLAQRTRRSRETIQSLVKNAPRSALRIFDVNLRPPFVSEEVIRESLALANVLKLNETELPQLATMLGAGGDERGQISELARRYNLICVAFTRGGKGSLLFAGGRWSDLRSIPTTVADTIGAGDSFTAAMALGLLAGWPLDEVNRRASELAAYVCSQAGATPAVPEALRGPFREATAKQ